MKYLIYIIFFTSTSLFSQNEDTFLEIFLLNDELKEENANYEYQVANFSHLWTETDNQFIYGMIGSNHQRIRIHFDSISQDGEDFWLYHVVGKSKVKNNICDFRGEIRVDSVFELKSINYGVDAVYKDSAIINQGVLLATYNFYESKDQKHSGIFSGKLMTKWYTTSEGKLKYDNIQFESDGYMNNAFIGEWKEYDTEKSKVCNWADYRIPLCSEDFDVGASQFSPSEKYYEFGWEQYQRAWMYNDPKAKLKELEEWWK